MDRILCALLIASLLVLVTLPPQVQSQETNSFETPVFTVYVDGYVFVDYFILIDSKNPTANISLFSQAISDTLVLDETGLPLDYSRIGNQLSVHSLGVDKVRVSYFTQDLTIKNGRFWTFNVTTTANATVILPPQALIVGFSQAPDLIDNRQDKTLLMMPAGEIEITYVVGVLGTKEYAQVVLNEAQQTINDVKKLNVNVSSAEIVLQTAWNLFSNGSYSEAESLGKQAKDLVLQANQTALEAAEAKSFALSEIAKAESEGRLSTLAEARELEQASENAFENGDYAQALTLANESAGKAKESLTLTSALPTTNSAQFPTLQASIAAISAVAASATGFIVFKMRQKKSALAKANKKKMVDVEKIFKRNGLRNEEKEAVNILVENNGEVMEAELYAKLNLPRTTTWRLVRRLEGMGVVEVEKKRRDNLIRLRK